MLRYLRPTTILLGGLLLGGCIFRTSDTDPPPGDPPPLSNTAPFSGFCPSSDESLTGWYDEADTGWTRRGHGRVLQFCQSQSTGFTVDGIRVFRVIYETVIDGTPVRAGATVLAPVLLSADTELSHLIGLSWDGRGTGFDAGPSGGSDDAVFALASALGRVRDENDSKVGNPKNTLYHAIRDRGFTVVAPDPVGTTRRFLEHDLPGRHHPYLDREAEGLATIDAVLAAYEVLSHVNVRLPTSTRYALVGGSQGGHATLAAASVAERMVDGEKWEQHLDLWATIPAYAPSGLAGWLADEASDPPVEIAPPGVSHMIYSSIEQSKGLPEPLFSALGDGELRAGERKVIEDAALGAIVTPPLTYGTSDDLSKFLALRASDPSYASGWEWAGAKHPLLDPTADAENRAAIEAALAEDDPVTWIADALAPAPVLLYQGMADTQLPVRFSDGLFDAMCDTLAGEPNTRFQYLRVDAVGHEGGDMQVRAVEWLTARFAAADETIEGTPCVEAQPGSATKYEPPQPEACVEFSRPPVCETSTEDRTCRRYYQGAPDEANAAQDIPMQSDDPTAECYQP